MPKFLLFYVKLETELVSLSGLETSLVNNIVKNQTRSQYLGIVNYCGRPKLSIVVRYKPASCNDKISATWRSNIMVFLLLEKQSRLLFLKHFSDV